MLAAMVYGDLPLIDTDKGQISGFPIQEPASEKMCVLRLPTNAELSVYLMAQRLLRRDLGRRQSEMDEVPTPKADLALFTACRLDTRTGPDWDDAEIEYAISVLLQHRILSVEKSGKEYTVTLGTLFGPVKHTLATPSRKDLRDYRNGVSKSRSLPNGVEEIRLPPDVPAALYDKLKVEATGYAEGFEIPLNHKRTVISEISNALALLDPAIDPNE